MMDQPLDKNNSSQRKQQFLLPNQQDITFEQRIMQQEHLKQQKMLFEHQKKQEHSLRELLELQDEDLCPNDYQKDNRQKQQSPLIQQQLQLHLQQRQQQQKEHLQQLQVLHQKQQQESQQTQIVVQQPQIVQQTQIIQSQQPQFVQQTVQPQSHDAQKPHSVQKSQPQMIKKTHLVQQLAQQSQPIQVVQQPHTSQQSQNVQKTQQNLQYTVPAKQTKKQPPQHSQQLLQQQLQQLLLNNKSLPQRIVVLGNQSQQQQLHQQPPRVISANQQHLLQQQVQCVVVTGTNQQQPQQRLIVAGNGHTQQPMQRLVVASTSQQQQQQQQIQRYVVANAGQQQQQQHAVVSSAIQQHSQHMQGIVTSSSAQQSQQIQRIVVSSVGPQQQQIPHVVTSTSSQQQQLLPQQSGQCLVIGQMKSSQQTQQVQSPSQCGAVSQFQSKDIQHSVATKPQQQCVVITKQSQFSKPLQQQLPQQILLTQKQTQQLLQPKQQNVQQNVIAINQQWSQGVDHKLQQQQQVPQSLPLNIAVGNQQSHQQINVQLLDNNLVPELNVKQSHQQLQQSQIQPSQTQLEPKQLNLQVQPQQNKQNHLKDNKQQEIMGSGLIFGQLEHQLPPDPEKLKLQMQLQQLQRQKLQELLLLQQQQHVQVQQKIKSEELKLQQKRRQQQLREQVLLQQHHKHQKQLQIRQQFLLKQQALSKNCISYVVNDVQEQKQQNDQKISNQQTLLPKPELLQPSEKPPDASQQCKSDIKCHTNNSSINTEEQLISSSSSDDDEEYDDTTQNHRRRLIKAERLVWERYDALSAALGPRFKIYYNEILSNWLHGRLSRVEFDRDIRKVLYVSWAVSLMSRNNDKNCNDVSNFTDNISKISSVIGPSSVGLETTLTTLLATSTCSSKQEFTSTRSKTKQHAASLSKNIIDKNKEAAMNSKRKEAVIVLQKRIPLHNAFIASLVEWMPLNSQRLNRRAARVRGVTETGFPIRLYTYADVPLARGSASHWYYGEPGSLTRWYWPNYLTFNSSMTSTNNVKSPNRSFLALEQKIATNAAVAAVSLKPPSRSLLPVLLRFAENKELLQATQRKWCVNMQLKKLMLKSKKLLPRQWSKRKRQLAIIVRLQSGHTQLLRALKAHNYELRSHEYGLMERLNRLKTRVSLRRRKVLALFKIRQQELKARLNKYFGRSWQKLPGDQLQEELLKEASIHVDDDYSDEDTEYDDGEGEGKYIFLKQHLDRVRLLEEERRKQQQHLKVINPDTIQKQMRRGRRPPLTSSTIQLLRDRQRIRACRQLLQTVKAERLQVNRDVDRVLELRHNLCPCGESDGRPCRYKNQMRRLLFKLQAQTFNKIDDQVQCSLAEEISKKEKGISEKSNKSANTILKQEELKIKKDKVVVDVPSPPPKKVRKADKKKATTIEKNVLNNKSKDLNKTVNSTSIEKTKALKNYYKKKMKRLSMETKATTTGIRVAPTLNDNETEKTAEKHDIGVSCDLIYDKNASQTSIYSPAFHHQSSLTTLGRRSKVDVAAAATRAANAALAASRRTEHQETITCDLSSTNSKVKKYADRQASELMPPPPPPPPPPSTKPSTTVKNPSVGARYLQQQQLLLDRHKQLERMRREERERQKRARFERRRLKQENSDNLDKKSSESPTIEMETDDSDLEFLQQEQKNRHEGKSYGIDPEAEELDHDVAYEEMRRRNDYFFYYGGADYYSSDEEMSGSPLNDPFPPLLHDLRIDQLPRPTNRLPEAALLPLGVRTRLSSVPLIYSNYKEFELSVNNEEHKTIESQKLTELNPEEHFEEKQKKDSGIKKPLPLSQNSFSTTGTSMETKGITESVKYSMNTKSPTVEKKMSKRLQSKLLKQKKQSSDDNLTVNKQIKTVEQKHKENEPSIMKMNSTTSPCERKSRRVSAKLPKIDDNHNAPSQEKEIDVKLHSERVKRKRDLVESPLIESKSNSKNDSKLSNSQLNVNKKPVKYPEGSEAPPLKKKIIEVVDLTHDDPLPVELKSDVNHVQPKKKKVTFQQEHLIIPTAVSVKNSNIKHDLCKNPVLSSDQGIQLRSIVGQKKCEKTDMLKLIKEFGELVIGLTPNQELPQIHKLKQIFQLPVFSNNQNKIPQSSLVIEVLNQLNVLLTDQPYNSSRKRKRKLSPLSTVEKKSEPKLIERLRSLLLQIERQWKDGQEFTVVKTIKSDEETTTLAANKNNYNDDKRLHSTSELADGKNVNDSGPVKKSVCPLIKQKQRLGKRGRARVEQDIILSRQQSAQKVSQTQKPKDQNTTNLVQINQRKRLELIKIFEKKKMLHERIKITLDEQNRLEKMHQERKNSHLEKLSKIRLKQKHSKCIWTLVESPVASKPYYNEQLSLREQLLRKTVKDKNVQQLHEVEQAQSNIATIGMVTQSSLKSENENKLEMRKKNCRGSGYWWNKVGLQKKTSPLVSSVNKRVNKKKKKLKVDVPLNRHVQRTKPQVKKTAAVVVENHKKTTPAVLTRDEKNKLKLILIPQILQMVTEAEGKWLEQLQSLSVELDQQVNNHFKAMEEKQQQQVQLLLKNGKRLKQNYDGKCNLKTKLIMTHPLNSVSKHWKQLENLRLKHQKHWKTKLTQLLETKMTNKLFFRELYDRLMKLLTSSDQNKRHPSTLSTLIQLQHKPLNAKERHDLQKLMKRSIQKFTIQTLPKQVKNTQVLNNQNKSSQKPTLEKRQQKKIKQPQLKPTQTQTKVQRTLPKKTKKQELPLKPKHVDDKKNQNKQPQSRHKRQMGKQNRQSQSQRVLRKKIKRGRVIARKKPKSSLAMKLRRLFQLRNRLINIQPTEKNPQPIHTTEIAGIKSKQQKENKSPKSILRKMTFLMYTQKIVLQRQLDRLNKWCPDTDDKHLHPFVLLVPKKTTTLEDQEFVDPVKLQILQPLSSKQIAKESMTRLQPEQQHMVKEKRKILKQQLSGVQKLLKPLMELWQLYLRFPKRWLHQQLNDIEKIRKKQLAVKCDVVNTNSSNKCLQKSFQRHNEELEVTTLGYKTQQLGQRIQRIREHLNWRHKRVRELLVEFSTVMHKEQDLILSKPTNPRTSFYSVSLRLGKPLSSKHMFSKYSALLRLQRSATFNKQNLSYSLLLKLEQSVLSTEISSNYSALLKLNKSSIRSALSTPLESSNSKHQFSVSLTPLQSFNINRNPSNILTIINSLAQSSLKQQNHNNLNSIQLYQNKKRFSDDGNKSENYCDNMMSVTTKKSMLPSLSISSNRSRCLTPVTQPKTIVSVNAAFNVEEKQISIVISSDSDDETETLKTSSSTNLVNPNLTKENVPEVGCSTVIILSSDEEIETTKKIKFTSDENYPNVIHILSSDEETEALDFELLPKIRKLDQTSKKSNTTVLSKPKEIENTVCRLIKTNKPMQTSKSKLLKVAIIDGLQTTMATSTKPLNLVSQCDRPLKLVATMDSKMKTMDANFLMAVIKKLTETAVSFARGTPLSTVQKEGSNIDFNQMPIKSSLEKRKTKNSSNNFNDSSNFKSTNNEKTKSDTKIHYLQPCDNAIPDQILRRHRRLIRTVTIDSFGPTVPKFCDLGFSDGTIEKSVHGRFVSTIMAMATANSIASYLPPQRPRLSIESTIAKQYGHAPTLSEVSYDENDKSDINVDKVTTSTNTPVQLSSIMDLLEKTDKASVETGCSTVHTWSGSARTSGTLLVSAIRLAKKRVAALRAKYMSQLETTTPFDISSRQSRTTVTKAEEIVSKPVLSVTSPVHKRSVSVTTAATSSNSNDCNRLRASKRSASVAFMKTPAVLSAAEDQRSKPSVTIVDTGVKEQQMSALQPIKRSADVAFSPESKSAVTSTTSFISTSPLVATKVKSFKRSKSAGLTETISAKPTTAKACVTPTTCVPEKHNMTSKVFEAKDFVSSSNNVVDQEKMTVADVTTEKGAVAKTTEITEEEMRTVTVTRTRCLTVPAPMDVTADACTLVVSACEEFVRAMVLERFEKAGRGFGTMELRRRDAFAAAMAFDENIRPTPEYSSTSKLAVTTADVSNQSTANNDSNRPSCKLLRPPTTSVEQRTVPTLVFDDELNTSTVLTVSTAIDTQTTTTTTTTITAVNEQFPTTTIYTVKPIPSSTVAATVSDTSARTRGVKLFKKIVPITKTAAVVKTVVDSGQRPETTAATTHFGDKLSSANLTSRVPDTAEIAAVVVPDSITEVVVNNRTPPITVTNYLGANTDEQQKTPVEKRGFYVERGRPLLRPPYQWRQPFGTLVTTSIMAALETTAENGAARKCVGTEKELEEKEDERSDGGGEEWGCYFGDSSCLPPASRLNLFLTIDQTSTPADAACPRASSSSGARDDSSLARQRKQLIDEIMRRQRCRDRVTREVEHRIREQRDRPRDTPEEYYQKFLQLQYGSKEATPGQPKMPRRLPNGVGTCRGIVSWY